MKRLSLRLISLVLCSLWCWTAAAQVFPNIPGNTILGRLGSGNPGPPQPIPFATFVKQLIPPAPINMVGYGCDPTGVVDCAALTSSALAVSPNIYFPPGIYKFSSQITYSIPAGGHSVSITGAGADLSILNWPNASGGLLINYTGKKSSVHIADLSFTTAVASGGDAIKLNGPSTASNPAVFAQSDITRVTVRGADGYAVSDYWGNGVNITSVSNVNIDGVSVYGAANGNGIYLAGTTTAPAVQINVTRSFLQNLGNGLWYDSYVEGVTVNQTNFIDNIGIYHPSGATGNDQLVVSASQFNCALYGVSSAAAFGIQLYGDLFIVGSGAVGVSLTPESSAVIIGNTFDGSSGTDAIVLSSIGSGDISLTVANNIITGFTTGLWLKTGTINANVQGNTFANVTTSINDQGTGTRIGPNNPGAAGVVSQSVFVNATSGSVVLSPVAGALGSTVLSLPASTGTLVSTGVLGTGVLTALGVNNGTAGAFLVNGASIPLVSLGWSITAPTIASGFCSTGSPVTTISASNGTAAFDILIGAATCGSTGTLTMPAATTGWVCKAADVTTPASHNIQQTGTQGSTTAVVLTDYSRTAGTAQNFNPADHVHVMCTAY